MLYAPSASTDPVMLHLPALFVVPAPRTVVLSVSYHVTRLPASATPVMMGFALVVTLSVFDIPVSDAAVMSGAEAAEAAYRTTETMRPKLHQYFRQCRSP